MDQATGIIYCASGEKYIREANVSVSSLKKHNNVDVTIFVDKENKKIVSGKFDNVLILESPKNNYYDKIDAIRASPYNSTIYLDTDTFIIDDIKELFRLLDRFDIAVAHSIGRYSKFDCKDIPFCFVQLNTGVIVYNNNQKIQALTKLWKELSDETRGGTDQVSFREAFYKSEELNSYILTPEYNFRLPFPNSLSKKVKIIHDHHFMNYSHKKKKKTVSRLNQKVKPRVYKPKINYFNLLKKKIRNVLSFFKAS